MEMGPEIQVVIKKKAKGSEKISELECFYMAYENTVCEKKVLI